VRYSEAHSATKSIEPLLCLGHGNEFKVDDLHKVTWSVTFVFTFNLTVLCSHKQQKVQCLEEPADCVYKVTSTNIDVLHKVMLKVMFCTQIQ
jgi:hypothetical protein